VAERATAMIWGNELQNKKCKNFLEKHQKREASTGVCIEQLANGSKRY
jgi:hypothetical protein